MTDQCHRSVTDINTARLRAYAEMHFLIDVELVLLAMTGPRLLASAYDYSRTVHLNSEPPHVVVTYELCFVMCTLIDFVSINAASIDSARGMRTWRSNRMVAVDGEANKRSSSGNCSDVCQLLSC